jgi:SSS family solute:Na+ symporter
MALAMIRAKGILDAWWSLSGVFGGGMLGIFLLGILSRRVKNTAAITATVGGVLLIFWMTFSGMPFWKTTFGEATVSPFNTLLVNVFGTAAIMILGFAVTLLFNRPVEK